MKPNEDINELLSRWMNSDEAKDAAGEINAGDRLFASHPAPALSSRRLEMLRSKVRHEVKAQHRTAFALRWLSAAASVAAVILGGLYVAHTVKPVAKTSPKPVTYAAAHVPVMPSTPVKNLWSRLSSNDSLVNILDKELTEVAESINAINSEDVADKVNILAIDMMELEELELIASNTDFWKG